MSLPVLALPLLSKGGPQEIIEYRQEFHFADCTPFVGIARFTPAYIDDSARVLEKMKRRYPERDSHAVRRPAKFLVAISQKFGGDRSTLFRILQKPLTETSPEQDDPSPTDQPIVLETTSEDWWKSASDCKHSMKKIIIAAMIMLRKLYPNVVQVNHHDQAAVEYNDESEAAAGLKRMQNYTTATEFEAELDHLLYRIRYYIQLGFEFYKPPITLEVFNEMRASAAITLLHQVENGERIDMSDVRLSLEPFIISIQPRFKGDLVKIASTWSSLSKPSRPSTL